MKEVTLESSQMIAKYSRKAKEPIELNDGVSGNYGRNYQFFILNLIRSKQQLYCIQNSIHI